MIRVIKKQKTKIKIKPKKKIKKDVVKKLPLKNKLDKTKIKTKNTPVKKIKLVKKTKTILKKKTKTKKVTKTSTKKIIKKIAKKLINKKKKVSIKIKDKNLPIKGLKLDRYINNPIFSPGHYSWERDAVINPAVLIFGGRVHLFYRALGPDGISRIGYASSIDGTHFDIRLTYPVFAVHSILGNDNHLPYTSPARMVYDPTIYTSGGGWGGCEDPRAVLIDGVVYMTFNVFNGWDVMRVAVASIKEEDLLNRRWNWSNFSYLSKPGERQKNWVLFPEKINGKFALFYNLDKGDKDRVHIKYLNQLNYIEAPSKFESVDPQQIPDHDVAWHYRTRSAASPPIKTKDGWLLIYHAMDRNEPNRYKVGAMLLDLQDPEKVLYRASSPILEPDLWYENDYKPGIVYASGAVVRDGTLLVYYGGGDKYIGVASINLDELLGSMKNNKIVKLKNNKL